jgi:hypothetical protein
MDGELVAKVCPHKPNPSFTQAQLQETSLSHFTLLEE